MWNKKVDRSIRDSKGKLKGSLPLGRGKTDIPRAVPSLRPSSQEGF